MITTAMLTKRVNMHIVSPSLFANFATETTLNVFRDEKRKSGLKTCRNTTVTEPRKLLTKANELQQYIVARTTYSRAI